MGGPLDHIGRVCAEARKHASLRQIDIAVEAGTSHVTVSRFETGERSVRELNDLIAAYARETGHTELDLWTRAIELWQNEE